MLLQSLVRYYDILSAEPDSGIAPFGYSTASVSFAVVLAPSGELRGLVPLVQSQMNGKKLVEVPRRMLVPERVVRTVGVVANFLCDTSAYVLGISERDERDPHYARQRFDAFRSLHLELLDGVDCPEAQAVAAFLRGHDPAQARQHPLIAPYLEKLLQGGSLVFMLDGGAGFAHEAPAVRRAWEEAQAARSGEASAQCLVTGEHTPIARLHPNLKGIRGGQASGVTLVGFNAPAYESYNRQGGQGWNAPTGQRAVFAYTTMLNYLLSRDSPNPKFVLGDTTVVYWAESADPTYAQTFSAVFDPQWTILEAAAQRDSPASRRMREIAERVKTGAALDARGLLEGLDPSTRFYVLGLAPNAARVAVRFFHRDLFVKLINQVMAHYQDLEIVREYADQPARISLRAILDETVSKKARDKEPSPILTGALLRAILNNTPYPAALFYALINRIRADMDDDKLRIRKINYVRAAVIKAYLTRKYRAQNQPHIQEVLCMALNEQSTHPAYLLGRLFAVLEKAQTDALGKEIDATIKDRYFTTACASPATVFPVLLRLAQHHISKAEYGYTSDRRIEQILGQMEMNGQPIPLHLSLDEQGIFVLGYYHQRAALFARRTDPSSATQAAASLASE